MNVFYTFYNFCVRLSVECHYSMDIQLFRILVPPFSNARSHKLFGHCPFRFVNVCVCVFFFIIYCHAFLPCYLYNYLELLPLRLLLFLLVFLVFILRVYGGFGSSVCLSILQWLFKRSIHSCAVVYFLYVWFFFLFFFFQWYSLCYYYCLGQYYCGHCRCTKHDYFFTFSFRFFFYYFALVQDYYVFFSQKRTEKKNKVKKKNLNVFVSPQVKANVVLLFIRFIAKATATFVQLLLLPFEFGFFILFLASFPNDITIRYYVCHSK